MGANIKLASAMNTTAKTMANMNKIMKPEQVASNMRAFGQASMKLDMTDEMSKYNSEIS
jgi:charged multivesicular body protein 2B